MAGVKLAFQVSRVIDSILEFFTFYAPYGLMSLVKVRN